MRGWVRESICVYRERRPSRAIARLVGAIARTRTPRHIRMRLHGMRSAFRPRAPRGHGRTRSGRTHAIGSGWADRSICEPRDANRRRSRRQTKAKRQALGCRGIPCRAGYRAAWAPQVTRTSKCSYCALPCLGPIAKQGGGIVTFFCTHVYGPAGLTPPSSAPGLGSHRPHLRRDWHSSALYSRARGVL